MKVNYIHSRSKSENRAGYRTVPRGGGYEISDWWLRDFVGFLYRNCFHWNIPICHIIKYSFERASRKLQVESKIVVVDANIVLMMVTCPQSERVDSNPSPSSRRDCSRQTCHIPDWPNHFKPNRQSSKSSGPFLVLKLLFLQSNPQRVGPADRSDTTNFTTSTSCLYAIAITRLENPRRVEQL